nr:HEAT repeat domain-containing protein [Okeania sp. SIO2C9]
MHLLRDDDWSVRFTAVKAVGNLDLEAKQFIPQLQQLLRDENSDVSSAAAKAVGEIGSEAKKFIPQLQQLLSDEDSNVRSAAATAVSQMGKLNTQEILPILNAAHKSSYEEARLRFIAYFVSAGESNAVTLIQWLGSPKEYPYENNKFDDTRKEGKKVLNLFAEIWEATELLEELRPELERQIAKVVDRVQWQPQDINLLTTHHENLKAASSTHADSINTKIKLLKGIQVFSYIWKFLLLHAITWFTLLSLYPKSREIQTPRLDSTLCHQNLYSPTIKTSANSTVSPDSSVYPIRRNINFPV